MEKYLVCLYKQYCDARGITINGKEVDLSKDFIEWIKNNRLLLNKYIDYLSYIGFEYDYDDMVEVGKGRYDSIANENMSVISNFGSTQEKNDSSLFIQNGVPYVIGKKEIFISQQHIILTHNPYYHEDILNWFLMHNLGDYNISIGMFGTISDQNARMKIKVLEEISKSMYDDYSLDYDTDEDKYFCSLNSKRYIKRYVKKIVR